MSKNVTVSVPDDLYEKMERWKGSFNFSGLFQNAVSKEIQKKEDFQNRLKEEPKMNEIVERLKKEKKEHKQNYYDKGKAEGLDWAKSANYADLLYASEWEPYNFVGGDPTKDEVIGDIFADVIEDNPNMDFGLWEKGWVAGVKAFWEEVKNKI